MAKYKKQSKKSPLKKYGRRNVRKLDVSEQKNTYASKAKAQGSLGRAIGSVGTSIGKAVDEAAGKKKKKAADAKKVQDKKLADTVKLDTSKLDPLSTEGAKLPKISQLKPRPPAPPTDPTPPPPPPTSTVVPPNTGIGGTQWSPQTGATGYDPRVQDRPLTENDAWGTTGAAAGMTFTPNDIQGGVRQPGSWYNPQHPGSGNIVTAQGRDQQSPINRIQPSYTKSPFRRNPYGNSPFKRMSPLKAKADEISAGTQYVEQLPEQRALSYLGEEGSASAEGYNAAIEQHNYKQRVWAQKAKDVDDAYGKLQVEPTGISSWDASAQVMAKEWKDEFTDLYNNKDSYSYEEYASKLSEIKTRASNYQNANQNIQNIVQDYEKNKDMVSASTDPTNIDILETLANGGEGLTTENVNGVPTLTGVTLGGQQVSVPISDIASGKNLWRVNPQHDVSGDITKIADDLGKFKTQVAQNSGLTTQSVGWDQLSQRAASQIDGILSNPQRTQAIAAEKFGIDYDEWNELGDEAATARVKQGLLQEIQTQFQPHQQIQTHAGDPRIATQQRQQQLDQAQQRINKPTAGQITTENAEENVNYAIQNNDFEAINGQLASKGYKAVMVDGQLVIGKYNKNSKNKSGYDVVSGGNEQTLIQLLGGKLNSPVNRSPFRRMMDFITGR